MASRRFTYWIIFVTFSFASSETQINSPCTTKYFEGTCQEILSCKFAIELLKKRDATTLRHMTCGYDGRAPKVCCPNEIIDQYTTTTNVPYKDVLYSKHEVYSKDDEVTAAPQTPPREIPSEILPDRNVCGQVIETDRIYGGQIADIEEFPWLARIKFLNPTKDTYTYSCAGSLINNRYVLTAAHCIGVLKIINVRLGEWDTETDIDCQDGYCNDLPVDVKVVKTIVYPHFDRKNITSGDIALLRLERPVNFTDFIQPICLPTTKYIARQDYIDSTYTTAGWGTTEFDQEAILKHKVDLNSVSYPLCRAALNLPETKSPQVICAGGRKGEDTCKGDSGGPLQRVVGENGKQNWYIYGITSYGVARCGAAAKPGIYARVSLYMDWILKTIAAG